MASKAKSGLSAMRQFPEPVHEPPNTYTVGAVAFQSSIRDGRGHSEYHVAVVNDNAFTLTITHSWRPAGAFTQDESIVSVIDPPTGYHVAEVIAPVTKRYVRVNVASPAPGLGANFELGFYFQPRASGPVVTSAGGNVVAINGNQQVQNVETVAPLGANATFDGASRDCINYEAFGVSVHLLGLLATTVTLNVQHRHDPAATWRNLETILLVVGAGVTVPFSRIYGALRRYLRVQAINGTANALSETEIVTMMKPLS